MKGRLAILGGLLAVAAVALHAQSKPAPVPPSQPSAASASANASADKSARQAKPFVAKTPWGDPDLQGVWDYKTITPLERPAAMGDRQFLNDEEVARLEGRRRQAPRRAAGREHAGGDDPCAVLDRCRDAKWTRTGAPRSSSIRRTAACLR